MQDRANPPPSRDSQNAALPGSSLSKKRGGPRKMNAQRLHRIALAYLERYEASEASLRAMLERRVWKAANAHGQDAAEFAPMIEDAIAKAIAIGFVDNARFASNQVRQQRARGASARAIGARLKAKGIDESMIGQALDGDERDDEAAAWRYAQRRRLGPFRLRERVERRDRDLAALCRAGFSFSLAASVIDGEEEQKGFLSDDR